MQYRPDSMAPEHSCKKIPVTDIAFDQRHVLGQTRAPARRQVVHDQDWPAGVIEGSFSDEERETIRRGNTALAALFNQDLHRFGYPVVEVS